MILFLSIAVCYTAVLLLYRPDPDSLKAHRLTLLQNLKAVKASLFSGLFVLVIFLVTSGYEFIVVDEHLFELLALKNAREPAMLRTMQLITHLFIHFNLYHVAANVSLLGVASAYERRVGSGRFLAVLAVSSAASIPSILFYSDGIAVCGLSGGIVGLAAAYFTDHENLTAKEGVYAVCAAAILLIIFTLAGELRSNSARLMSINIDHVGHVMGAVSGVIYCRMTSKKSKGASKGSEKPSFP